MLPRRRPLVSQKRPLRRVALELCAQYGLFRICALQRQVTLAAALEIRVPDANGGEAFFLSRCFRMRWTQQGYGDGRLSLGRYGSLVVR
jgi:hypothetical protein